jgi:hypothetical protein
MKPGDELDAFLGAVKRLGEGPLLALSARPSADEADALAVARALAGRVAARKHLTEDLERLQGDIIGWSAAGGAHAGIWAPDMAAGNVLLEDLRRGAAPAILDAATAILLGEALEPHSRAVLRRRWESVTG